jgi:hypothetical protein
MQEKTLKPITIQDTDGQITWSAQEKRLNRLKVSAMHADKPVEQQFRPTSVNGYALWL